MAEGIDEAKAAKKGLAFEWAITLNARLSMDTRMAVLGMALLGGVLGVGYLWLPWGGQRAVGVPGEMELPGEAAFSPGGAEAQRLTDEEEGAGERTYASYREWAELDWVGLMAHVEGLRNDEELERFFREWASLDPVAALRSLEAFAASEPGDRIYHALLLSWSDRDVAAAARFGMESPWTKPGIMGVLLRRLYEADPDQALQLLVSDSTRQDLESLVAGLVRHIAADSPVDALDLATALSDKMLSEELIVSLAESALSRREGLDVDWLNGYLRGSSSGVVKRALLLVRAKRDPYLVAAELGAEGGELRRDLMPKIVARWPLSEVEAATEFVSTIEDRATRIAAAERLYESWKMVEPEHAREWAARMGLEIDPDSE